MRNTIITLLFLLQGYAASAQPLPAIDSMLKLLGGMLSGIKYSFINMKENLVMLPENAQAFERNLDMLDTGIREMRRVAHNLMPEILLKYGLHAALKEFCNEIGRSGVITIVYQPMGLEKQQSIRPLRWPFTASYRSWYTM
ncbi:hypothetical protein [Paraflavitalea speifideaquila]|uniref:hypothetical protein n=1 Tax=Paraflavitalea speifideaquila TaxID=3076558 RepID=UPI0028F115D3|nr:hypothetical protein [Paraflavitalea speifideiaquila]